MNFSSIFGGREFSDENPAPGKVRLSTMMNNFMVHERDESAAERLMEGNEPAFDEEYLNVRGSTRAEEHLARREYQQAMIDGNTSNPTENAKEKLKALIEGWSYQPPQKADETGEMEELGMVPDTDADDEEVMKVIRGNDPAKILSMVLKVLVEGRN